MCRMFVQKWQHEKKAKPKPLDEALKMQHNKNEN